jgi:hypothetical protein
MGGMGREAGIGLRSRRLAMEMRLHPNLKLN